MKSYTVTDANVQINKLVPGGQALATLPEGKKAFFWNALPGETVTSYQVTKSKSSYLEAIALTIANPSPHRIEPRDPCYLSTSPWQIMDYDYELQQKVALAKECFRQVGFEDGFLRNIPRRPVQIDNVHNSESEVTSSARNLADVVNLNVASEDHFEKK